MCCTMMLVTLRVINTGGVEQTCAWEGEAVQDRVCLGLAKRDIIAMKSGHDT